MKNAMRLAFLGMVFLAMGCGFEDPVEAYAGVWNYSAGSNGVINCADVSTNLVFEGNVNLIAGNSVDLVWSDSSCNLNFDVNGTTATIIPGQSCSSGGNSIHWANWTMPLSGSSITITASGNFTDGNINCAITKNASLTRVGG